MAREKVPTERLQVMLPVAMIEYLRALARRGTHGSSVPDVAKTLIEQGVRQAIKDGFVALEPD